MRTFPQNSSTYLCNAGTRKYIDEQFMRSETRTEPCYDSKASRRAGLSTLSGSHSRIITLYQSIYPFTGHKTLIFVYWGMWAPVGCHKMSMTEAHSPPSMSCVPIRGMVIAFSQWRPNNELSWEPRTSCIFLCARWSEIDIRYLPCVPIWDLY